MTEENGDRSSLRQIGQFLVPIGFIFMIGFADPFKPLQFPVSLLGFAVGVYFFLVESYPDEARHFRHILLTIINSILDWINNFLPSR